MSAPHPVIDAYAHVGLPRFVTLAHYQQVMATAGIGRAVLCSFDSSPDLFAIHAAMRDFPDRFRGLGVPIGNDRSEVEIAVRAQLAAGFSGIRLSDADVVERPWLLDLIADHGAIAIVCGRVSSQKCVSGLLHYFERYPAATVIGGHFAGGGRPNDLATGDLAQLLKHPRFFVVFSRQGAFAEADIRAWANAILTHTGWSRIMWGSEVPILFWRDETIADALAWVDRLAPMPDERENFLHGNAARLYFTHKLNTASLVLPFDPLDRTREIPAGMWARSLPVSQSIAGRLVHEWLASGGTGTLGQYLESVLDRTLPPQPDRHKC